MKEEQTSVYKSLIIGRNPVLEALKSGRDIEKLIIGRGTEGSIRKIIGIAKEKGIAWQYADKAALDRISEGKVHQGVIAYVSEYAYYYLEDILKSASQEGPFIIILMA